MTEELRFECSSLNTVQFDFSFLSSDYKLLQAFKIFEEGDLNFLVMKLAIDIGENSSMEIIYSNILFSEHNEFLFWIIALDS